MSFPTERANIFIPFSLAKLAAPEDSVCELSSPSDNKITYLSLLLALEFSKTSIALLIPDDILVPFHLGINVSIELFNSSESEVKSFTKYALPSNPTNAHLSFSFIQETTFLADSFVLSILSPSILPDVSITRIKSIAPSSSS